MKTWIILTYIFLAGYILPQSGVSPQKSWTVLHSPTRNKISYIIAFNNGRAIAASNKLYYYNSVEWREFPVQPPISEISKLFALHQNHIWVTKYLLNNESDFYVYRYGTWNKIRYPLVNGIYAVSLNQNNDGWYCGDREIAYQESGRHYYIPYPSTADYINSCYGTYKNNLWVNTNSGLFFYYNGKNWIEPFPGKKIQCFYFRNRNNGYAVVDKSLYQYSNGKWKLHSEHELLQKLTKIIINNSEFWGIGSDGLLIHYKSYWYPVELPVSVDLYDISFSSNGTGWIVGDKGTILKYTSEKVEKFTPQPGFDRHRILSVAKETSDEYGVVIEDFNNNGYKDIYATCIFDPSRIYMNKSEKNKIRFDEEGMKRNITGRIEDKNKNSFSELYSGAGSGDIDNDGDQDLYLCNLLNENKLFLNDGSGNFRDVSAQNDRATKQKDRTNSAIFGDVDNDGDLDLFIANEYSTNRLYLNNGYGYFKEVTELAGLTTKFGGMGGVFSDIDNDNDLDLFVVNWSTPNILYENVSSRQNGVKFINISEESGLSDDTLKKSNAAVFADYDNDGDPDLFVTNRRFTNRFYRNDGNKHFTDVTESLLGFNSTNSYGVNFADFDNDGYLDLFVANVDENKLYKNIRGRKFVDVTRSYGVELGGYSTGSSCGDVDNDGDVDLYVANYIDDNSMLFLNNINNDNFININVTGKLSNRDAVGVKAYLYSAGKAGIKKYLLGYREISGGSGYSSKDAREIHFGVKPGTYDIMIIFPSSGAEKILTNIKNGSILHISEFDGFYSYFYSGFGSFKRFIYNRENQKEIVKFILIAFIINLSYMYGVKKYKWKPKYNLIVAVPLLTVYLFEIMFLRYENFFYSTITPMGSVLVILTVIHIYFEKNLMKEKVLEEKQKTRDTLARDLHDDLASTISTALIYTDLIVGPEIPEKSRNLLSKVHNLLRDAAGSVTDIIWTVSPRHDNIEDLVTRLQLLMDDLCRVNSIEFQSELNIDDYSLKITDAARRNIYLIYKEAINNIIKHSSASKVEFNVYLEDDLLNFSLYDNGIGFENSSDIKNIFNNPGNGLRNIQARAGEINAELQIRSGSKKGTYINLKQKIS